MKSFLLALEGLFRLLPDNTLRTDEGVVDAVASCLQDYNCIREYVQVCTDTSIFAASNGVSVRRCPHQRGREGGEEGQVQRHAMTGWPLAVADMLAKVAGPLQKDLLDERSLVRFIWRGARSHPAAGQVWPSRTSACSTTNRQTRSARL